MCYYTVRLGRRLIMFITVVCTDTYLDVGVMVTTIVAQL